MTLILRASQSLTEPMPDTPVLPPRVLASDAFTGGNRTNIVGRTTDSDLGGNPVKWEGSANMAAIVDGSLRRGAGTDGAWFVGVTQQASDYEFSMKVNAQPSGSSVFLDARRSSKESAGMPDAYRLALSSSMYLQKRSSGTATTIISSSGLPGVEIGKRYGVLVRGAQISVTVDGEIVASYTDPAPLQGPGWAGLAGSASVTSFDFDDLVIRATSAA